MGKPDHARVLDILKARQHKAVPTRVILRDGRVLLVHNVAWGYDSDDPVAHITTNISPSSPSVQWDFFFASEVVRLEDPENDAVWFEAPTPVDWHVH